MSAWYRRLIPTLSGAMPLVGSAMSTPAVECSGLTKRFNAVTAVQDVSIVVEEGSFLALVGPSGCGKTTTLRLIAGFEAPDAGTVVIRGTPASGPGVFVAAERRRVGMVFQDYALFPHLTIERNVAYGLAKGPHRNKRVQEMLELVGLSAVRSRHPHELSGGEQQRVALARALAPNPAIVLLDEPFSNLDAGLRARVRSDVKNILTATGTAAVLVTHDQEEALSLADRVGVMLEGRVHQVGTAEDIYAAPASLAVAAFVGEANMLQGESSNGTVATELGVLQTSGHASGRVKVLVRPEVIQLHPPDGTGPTFQVIDREFYGHDQVVRLRLPSGGVLRVRCGPDQAVEPGGFMAARVTSVVPVFPEAD